MNNSTDTYVAYYRLSKQQYNEDGTPKVDHYGIDSQMEMVQSYVRSHGGKLVAEYQEIQSGTSQNRKRRVEIINAVNMAKETNSTLIFAYIDRAARDLEFATWLQNTGLRLRFCDTPNANELVINILSAVAQDRSKMDSIKIKRALEQRRKQGKPMGCHAHKKDPGKGKWNATARDRSLESKRISCLNNPHRIKGENRSFILWLQGYTYRQILQIMRKEDYRGIRGNLIQMHFLSAYLSPQVEEFLTEKRVGDVLPDVPKYMVSFASKKDPIYVGPRIVPKRKDYMKGFTPEHRARMGWPREAELIIPDGRALRRGSPMRLFPDQDEQQQPRL